MAITQVPPPPLSPATAPPMVTVAPARRNNFTISLIGVFIGTIIALISARSWLSLFITLPQVLRIHQERIHYAQAIYSPQAFFTILAENNPKLPQEVTKDLWFDGADTIRALPLLKPMPWITSFVIEDTPLEKLPPNIDLFTHLQQLIVRNTRINNVPTSIGNISTLEELYLDGNNISRLPESIGNLTQLNALSLAYNNLEELPQGMQYLTNLTELDLTGNHLREFPRVLPPNLEILFIGGNRIPLEKLHKATLPVGEDIFY